MQIMVIEDDPSTQAILVRLVQHIWPQSTVSTFQDAPSALARWQQVGADLILVDLGLSGVNGMAVLEAVRKSPKWVPCVVISGRADREAVITARRLRVDAYIVKPIRPRELIERLKEILHDKPPTEGEPPAAAAEVSSILEFVKATLKTDQVSMPIDPAVVEALDGFAQRSAAERTELLNRLSLEPALVTRLLGLSNVSPYAVDGTVLNTFARCAERVGKDVLINLANEISLYPGNVLSHPELAKRNQALRQDCLEMRRIITELRRYAEFDLHPCATACLLYRIGEQSILQLMQRWADAGNELTAEDCEQAMRGCSAEASNRIKGLWQLPIPVRMLVGATYALPQGALKMDIIAMRVASLLLNQQHSAELHKLLASLSIDQQYWDTLKALRQPEDAAEPVAAEGVPPPDTTAAPA